MCFIGIEKLCQYSLLNVWQEYCKTAKVHSSVSLFLFVEAVFAENHLPLIMSARKNQMSLAKSIMLVLKRGQKGPPSGVAECRETWQA